MSFSRVVLVVLQTKKDRCKKDYYQRLLSNTSQKNAWRIVGDVLGRNGVNDAPRSVYDNGGVTTTDMNKICQLFNEFFCSVGHKLAATIPSDRNICRFNTLPRRPDSMFLSPTTYNEVVSLINQLDTKKCAGPDNISATFIKVHYEVFAQMSSMKSS